MGAKGAGLSLCRFKSKLCVFVLQVQLSALHSAHTPSLLLLLVFFSILCSMCVFARLLVTAECVSSSGGFGHREDALF